MPCTVSTEYISAACSCTPGALDWGHGGRLCFGSCQALAVAEPLPGGDTGFRLTNTLHHHAGDVIACRWARELPSDAALPLAVTGSRDHAAALWDMASEPPAVAARLVGHGGPPWLLVGSDDAAIVVFAPGEDGAYAAALRLVGHEDWVRCLDVAVVGGDLLLASGGQDATIRVWTVREADDAAEQPDLLRLHSQTIAARDRCGRPLLLTVTLESVLSGHEGRVYGLRWRPRAARATAAPPLASAAMDGALLVWERDAATGVWVEAARLGAVGGSGLGLLGCAWSPRGDRLAAQGQRGALHVWAEAEPGLWRPAVPCGGHAGPVSDLAWAPGGGYLLTCGRDQTTRLHGRWASAGSWHEMGRPQVHGHDLDCLAAVSDARFASGAEEKVARAFAMPVAVRETLATLCGPDAAPPPEEALPDGAAVPSLGLSNKPVFATEETAQPMARRDQPADACFVRPQLRAPPTEETLLQDTLWPELRKLYGHGFELLAMAASGDGRLLATACRAAHPEHAAVLLWETADWRQVGALGGVHQLSVVQLAFSPDDRRLLTVSRDRTWSVFERVESEPPAEGSERVAPLYRLAARGVRAHSRIIWCCAWLPDGGGFVTGSRDGQLLRREGAPYRPGAAVTAVAAAPSGLFAVGLETGCVRLLNWSAAGGWVEQAALDTSAAHHSAVKRLQFRPGPQEGATDLLASCAADHAVKLHRIKWGENGCGSEDTERRPSVNCDDRGTGVPGEHAAPANTSGVN
ncbi:probable elongator complex protein 2 [Pollicipes pollicipes]|uniref:probable elongator complex protein 2 n=1 Tax=Pollicipes pollicipes TaxID=41117 RepID=UPI0018854ED5|nr:probable elongator complex protein 2 [Pollicipes pollicipes]